MDTVSFLEKLATCVHHHTEINKFINEQSDEAKSAILANDAEKLKKIISPNTTYYADKTGVVRA